MNCFNIREVESLLRNKFFFELSNSKLFNQRIDKTSVTLKYKLNNLLNIDTNYNLFYTYALNLKNNFNYFNFKIFQNLYYNNLSFLSYYKISIFIINNIKFILFYIIEIITLFFRFNIFQNIKILNFT
jgi:hypothetical protein